MVGEKIPAGLLRALGEDDPLTLSSSSSSAALSSSSSASADVTLAI